jgi:hypothetical protein
MALPNGAGGYQLGDGNLNELRLGYTSEPLSVDSTATLTAAQVTNGFLITGNLATTAQTYTLPPASQVDAILTSAKVGSTFDLTIVNIGTTSGTGTLSMGSGTGFTNGGNATVAVNTTTSALFRFRKTGEGAYTVYKVA